MPKYFVTLEETVLYTVEVDADNDDQAAELAGETWAQSSEPSKDFACEGKGSEVVNVEVAS